MQFYQFPRAYESGARRWGGGKLFLVIAYNTYLYPPICCCSCCELQLFARLLKDSFSLFTLDHNIYLEIYIIVIITSFSRKYPIVFFFFLVVLKRFEFILVS